MLEALQQHLSGICQVEHGERIADYLVTDPQLARVLGGTKLVPDTDETVLLLEDDTGLSLSVYLDESLLNRLNGADPLTRLEPAQLADLWTVLEGISHFNYLVWSAQRDRQVTLLELEMQAEVDKFAATWLLAMQQDDPQLAERMHGWLFDDVSYNPRLSREQRLRYLAASDYAARYCAGLCRRLRVNEDGGLHELRQFYRLTQTDKISHIHTQAWMN